MGPLRHGDIAAFCQHLRVPVEGIDAMFLRP